MTKAMKLTYDEALILCRSGDVDGAFMVIGDRRYALRPALDTAAVLLRTESFAAPDLSVAWLAGDVEALGAEFIREVPAHPHGLIPDEKGAVIRCNGGIYVHDGDPDYPWDGTVEDSWPRTEMQALADEHGFTVLGDVEAARAEGVAEGRHKGRNEGIREVHDFRWSPEVPALTPAQRQGLRDRFPEAFEETDQ